jgi:hypothetical protein
MTFMLNDHNIRELELALTFVRSFVCSLMMDVLAHGAALVYVLQPLRVPGVVALEHGLLASDPEARNTRT